jgi:hypothetical protein
MFKDNSLESIEVIERGPLPDDSPSNPGLAGLPEEILKLTPTPALVLGSGFDLLKQHTNDS